jgi:hypothetical protein
MLAVSDLDRTQLIVALLLASVFLLPLLLVLLVTRRYQGRALRCLALTGTTVSEYGQ